MFDFSIITQWFDQLLRVTVGCPERDGRMSRLVGDID